SADGKALTPGSFYSHKSIDTGSQNDVRVLALSRDGRFVASGSMAGTLRFADVVNRKLLEPESEFGGTVSVLTFTPDGLALAGANGLFVVDLVADTLVGHEFAVDGRDGI